MKPKRSSYSQRKAKARITDTPFRRIRYFKRIEIDPMLSEIKKRRKGDPIRKSLCNFIIIRTISIFEFYMLNEIGRLADKDKTTASEFFKDVRIDVPISHQLASMYNFADIKQVNELMSKFIGEDFLKAIFSESVDYAPDYSLEVEHVKYTTPLHKNWTNVLEIFDYRDELIHHNKMSDFTWTEIRNIVGGIMQFILCSLMVSGRF
ncbi:hypothetical protein [Nitrosopumilus sp. S6]